MKRRITSSVIFALTAALLVVSYSNCQQTQFEKVYGGTTIGNPLAPVSYEILLAMCGVINRCNPQVTLEQCQSGVLAAGGFSTPLGVSSNYATFSSISQAETTGVLVGNPTSGANCYDAINSLTCADPGVASAYDSTSVNPFSGAAGMIPVSSCNQSFSPKVNLEVPIELVEHGLLSNTASTTFLRTRTSLNTADYDGTVTYYFEVVANNTDTVARNVSLVDSSGAKVATVQFPGIPSQGVLQDNTQRMQVGFTPTAGANDYRVMLDGTTTSQLMLVTEARIRVKQVGATMTKIYVPLVQGTNNLGSVDTTDLQAGVDTAWSSAYGQQNPDWYGLWKKNDSAFSQLSGASPFTLEAVLSSTPGTTMYASLFDASTGNQVFSSEVSTTSTTPTLVSQSFPDGAANFNDLDLMQVEIKSTASSGGTLYHAGLWIKLTNLVHAEVYYRTLTGNQLGTTSSSSNYTPQRTSLDPTLFSSPSVYFEELGYMATAGGTCTTAVYDNGTADSGTAGAVIAGSNIALTSTAKSLQRSPALSLVPGDRYTVSIGPNTGTSCLSLSSIMVIGF